MPDRNVGARPQWRLADRIRRAREYAQLEQRELADRAGISQATISSAETGRARPHRSTVYLIAAATGVSFEWLAGDDDDELVGRRRPASRYASAAPAHVTLSA